MDTNPSKDKGRVGRNDWAIYKKDEFSWAEPQSSFPVSLPTILFLDYRYFGPKIILSNKDLSKYVIYQEKTVVQLERVFCQKYDKGEKEFWTQK